MRCSCCWVVCGSCEGRVGWMSEKGRVAEVDEWIEKKLIAEGLFSVWCMDDR